MKVIDLTHTISEDMPVFSGSEAPKLTTKSTYKRMVLKKHINDNLNMYINDHLRMYTSDYALI